jgi:hypothetical protein
MATRSAAANIASEMCPFSGAVALAAAAASPAFASRSAEQRERLRPPQEAHTRGGEMGAQEPLADLAHAADGRGAARAERVAGERADEDDELGLAQHPHLLRPEREQQREERRAQYPAARQAGDERDVYEDDHRAGEPQRRLLQPVDDHFEGVEAARGRERAREEQTRQKRGDGVNDDAREQLAPDEQDARAPLRERPVAHGDHDVEERDEYENGLDGEVYLPEQRQDEDDDEYRQRYVA